MKELFRKVTHFLIFYPIYYYIWFFFLGQDLLNNTFLMPIIALFFGINFIDILIRPMSDPDELKDKYTVIVLLFFLSGPLILLFAFYENLLIISLYLPMYDNLLVSNLGTLLMIIGSIIMLSSRYQLNKHSYGGVSLSEEKEQTLLTEGMFKYIRHPIYAGGLIITIGLELAFRSLIILSLHTLVFLLIFRDRMQREEIVLSDKFGKEYRDYVKKTKRLIPYIY
ncbi:MAG: methyltransferase family protein, partial [Candidatus Hodarchaeota archaeon]